jgi:hypothetical protein
MQLTTLVTTLLSIVLIVDKEMILEWLDKIYLRNIVERYISNCYGSNEDERKNFSRDLVIEI